MDSSSNSSSDSVDDLFRESISHLRKPVKDLESLTSLLATPLAIFGVLPSHLVKHAAPLTPKYDFRSSWLRFIPLLQEAILQHILHIWLAVLREENLLDLMNSYFCPSPNSQKTDAAGVFALHAFNSLLPLADDAYAIEILARLTREYTVLSIHSIIYFGSVTLPSTEREELWQDYVRSIFAIPGKVTNASGQNGEIPQDLKYYAYFSKLLIEIEGLLNDLASRSPSNSYKDSLTHLVIKLANTGMLPSSTSHSPSQPSYFSINKEKTRKRLQSPSSGAQYSELLISLTASLPALVAQKLLTSLLNSLEWNSDLDISGSASRRIAKEAAFLEHIIGPLHADQAERWSLVSGTLIGRPWPEEVGRVLVRWAAGAGESNSEEALGELMSRTLDLWTSPQHIKYSLLSRHRYVTTILLLAASCLPATSHQLHALSKSPAFLEAIAIYIGHADPTVKRCGMLVAEVVAKKMGQKLDFGDWEEAGQGREWCRAMRWLVDEGGDVGAFREDETDQGEGAPNDAKPAELSQGIDSDDDDDEGDRVKSAGPPGHPALDSSVAKDSDDDSLVGYGSNASSRSPSPTPSELDEIEKDPTLVSGAKKVQRPVYLIQLGQLLVPASRSNEKDEADRIEMALSEGAALIRRKAGFGLELEENAVNLACAFVRLQDNYDSDGFDEKRQEALNALVVCCPRRAAPCLIEQFFTGQYSVSTRFAIMIALALGARELSGLTAPLPNATGIFPSKMLPSALHRKYLTKSDLPEDRIASPVPRIMEGLSRQIIDKTRDANEDKVPQLVREKQLRVRNNVNTTGRPISILDIGGRSQKSSFNDIAAESFIMPLINRFWIHLRDEQSRESRSRGSRTGYKGAGTGMILGAMTLAQFLLTLAILLHAGRNSPAFLAVLAPESLELAVTMGTRPVSETNDNETGGGKKANVLAAALELALVILDMSWEMDAGRTLSMDHVRVLLAVREWAEGVFKVLEKGALVDEGGGEGERRVRRASAGTLLTIEQITEKWAGAMIRL